MVTPESRKSRKFLKGLRAGISDQVAILRPSSYAEVLEHAQLVEDLISVKHQRIARVRTQQLRRRLPDLVSSHPDKRTTVALPPALLPTTV